MINDYHTAVLLQESIELLDIKPYGIYVDATFGAGGHSRSILNKLDAKGHIYSFDQDPDALTNGIQDENFTFIDANFRYLRRFLRLYGVTEVDGILADLGVSSHQFDVPDRGFSYRYDAPLDMRMNAKAELNAAEVLRTYSEEELVKIFGTYGEVRNSKVLAKTILKERAISKIHSTVDLNRILDKCLIGPKMKYYSQVYQALRMEVNDELGALRELMVEGSRILKKGGRMVIITFHSIEDKVVKNFFKTGNIEGVVESDEFGNISRPFRLINKKVIMASQDELNKNMRSRSAKLRCAEKI